MENITKALVEGIAPPLRGQIFVRDNELTGFALRVTERGVKSFVWEGRVKGRMRRITLGQFPALTVRNARDAALEMKSAVAHGQDPVRERRAARAELVFGSVGDEENEATGLVHQYLERHAKPQKRSWKEDEAILKNHIPAGWHGRKLSDILRQDVIRQRDKIQQERGPYAANHLIRLLRAMFNLARDWGFISVENPATRIKLLPETKRDRFLSPEELRRVNLALASEPNQYWRAYFAISLFLGTRKNELLTARWEDIDFEQKTWRIPETKAGRPHLLPLPSAALSILESLPSRESDPWVFPSFGSSGHLVDPKKAWQRIRKAAKVTDVRIHDLRRTLGSWLAASGYSLTLIGRTLNHSNVSTTAVYARLDLDPVRQALEQNAERMLALPTGKSKKKAARKRGPAKAHRPRLADNTDNR